MYLIKKLHLLGDFGHYILDFFTHVMGHLYPMMDRLSLNVNGFDVSILTHSSQQEHYTNQRLHD